MAAYSEKLKDPRWQKKRLEILERDDWTCQMCGDTRSTLHVHHRMYISGLAPWDYPDNLLTVLCESCHQDAGPLVAEEQRLLLEFLHGDIQCTGDDLCNLRRLLDMIDSESCYPFEVQLSVLHWWFTRKGIFQHMTDMYFKHRNEDYDEGLTDVLPIDGDRQIRQALVHIKLKYLQELSAYAKLLFSYLAEECDTPTHRRK